MKFVRDSSEAEMVSEFLKAELNSARWGTKVAKIVKRFNASKDIINKPNLSDRKENAIRRKVLGEFRGYKRNKSLFQNFPKNVRWKIVLLDKNDFKSIKYINYDYWVHLSGGTRLVKDGVKNIRNGVEVFDKSNEQFFKLAKYVEGGGVFPKIILMLTGSKQKRLTLLEGHVRFTSYLLSKFESTPLEAVVGFPKVL